MALDSENALAYNNLGNALATQGDLERAISAYERAIALDPNLEAAQTNLELIQQSLIQPN
ncbi:MAG: tetratricopeptide repeat protein [Pseudanabaenales cyanobacterium]|nr:tetratricopeptide repeat protein [Pseudanabaenales cyanobacterium]